MSPSAIVAVIMHQRQQYPEKPPLDAMLLSTALIQMNDEVCQANFS